MKLAYVDLCGFRGYRKRLRVDFAEEFTILDGRNGVGKSTIFDAVEFALTGHLSKYKDAKADGETVADYIWWTGSGSAPDDRYVEVGFRDGDDIIPLRRTEFGSRHDTAVIELAAKLCDLDLAPGDSLSQLCSTSIIRDEHITGLSLDLKETDRYAMLRGGLGASDSDDWVARGAQLLSATKERLKAAEQKVESLNKELMAATRRVDEVRAGLVDDDILAGTVDRLRDFSKSEASADQLSGPVRVEIANVWEEILSFQELSSKWEAAEEARESLSESRRNRDKAAADVAASAKAVEEIKNEEEKTSSSELTQQARDLIALADLGRHLGLQDGHCPLCGTDQDHAHYQQGVSIAENLAKTLDRQAAEEAQRERVAMAAEKRFEAARDSLNTAEANLNSTLQTIQDFDDLREASGLSGNTTRDQLSDRSNQLRETIELAQRDLRILETVKLNTELEHANLEESRSKERLAGAQERAGRARKAETTARALHDATRRAAGEALDRRLDRVLPLMSELYRRLRPHPIWQDIEYSIRGEVRKFLKLQVGDGLNPQFLFSSGQRRATGLAFLLSVNLSLAWNRWRTIMLDDPVQHVDDFRTVHLAELTAQLVSEGRQIVCAVEDAALAELLCRRLPVRESGAAKQITMGRDEEGDLIITSEKLLPMLSKNAFLAGSTIAERGGTI